MLAHTHSCSVTHSTNCHAMASIHSSPPDTWAEHLHHVSDMSVQPKNTLASPNVTTPPNNKKTCLAKAKWTATEEAALVTVLSDQKCIGNSSERSLKGTMWRMVEAAVRVIGEGPSKSSKQCKVQYQWVSHRLSILGFCSPLLTQGRVQAHQGALRSIRVWVECGFAAGNGTRLSMGQFSQGMCPSFYCQVITNIQYMPVSSRELPCQEKGFLLFDELAYLCDNVLATGVGAFRGTGMGSGDLDGEGTVEEEDEEQEEGEDEPGLSQVSCVSLSEIHMTADIASI